MKKDNFDNKNAGSRKTALMTSAKSSEERFARQLGKLGSSIFIIIVAMYFKIPDRVQNLYLMIALLMLIYQPMFRTVSGLLKKTHSSINWMETGFVMTSILGVFAGHYLVAALIMVVSEIIETVRTRPL